MTVFIRKINIKSATEQELIKIHEVLHCIWGMYHDNNNIEFKILIQLIN